MKKILITGSHGFLARNIAFLLNKKSCNVYGIGNGKWNKKQYQKWSYNYLVNKEVTLKNYPLLQRKKLKHFIISLGQNHRRLQIIFMN